SAINQLAIRHTLAFMSPSNPAWSTNVFRGFQLFNPGASLTDNLIAANISAVDSGTDNVVSPWTGSNRVLSRASLPALQSADADPFTGTTGAQLCFRWNNRAVTSTPLWPWPMNDRIKAATAEAGAYSGPCNNCRGRGPATRTQTDVQADI